MSKPKYYLSKDNHFVIENYNAAPPFASFFPGIAGIFGCPMWVFYANRGQCITSAGVQDKNGAIIEFEPANKAYHHASLQGFRTFLKIEGKFYEPFSSRSNFNNQLSISPDSLHLIEVNTHQKIKVEVIYFTIPNEPFPALARQLKITNLSSRPIKIEVLDGLPVLIPFGFEDSFLKRISQTIEAWCTVENLDKAAPFYKLKVMPADVAETHFLKKGNFFISFSHQDQKDQTTQLIVNPATIFGENSSFEIPANFFSKLNFKTPAHQLTEGFIPCAFSYKNSRLLKNGTLEIFSVFGTAEEIGAVNKIKKRISSKKYIETKMAENQKLIKDISSTMSINSASPAFDQYSEYTFLDNAMRGGLPVSIGKKVVYLYYRKHGDMERDYNDFKLMPTYLSQGTGNYRDINQNRRNDLFFNPEVAEDNILRFFNLIQLDGFNPLVVLSSHYFVDTAEDARRLIAKHIKNPIRNLEEIINRPFLLGTLLQGIENAGIKYKTSRKEFVEELLDSSSVAEGATHGEGFWIDHFSYNTDLLESFECLYPERIKDLLFNQKRFSFFDNEHIVVPRKEKYRLAGKKVRQYESVRIDAEKAMLINSRETSTNTVRSEYGKGKIYYSTLIAKLLCLMANKAASFDASGIGLEMEADKPDWYDALNGLPGLFGSSLSETLELKRICIYVLKHFSGQTQVQLPAEISSLICSLNEKLSEFFRLSDSFKYWEETYQLKEEYREKTHLGLSGEENQLSGRYLVEFIENIIKKCDFGIDLVMKKYKNYCTYFINEVTDFEVITDSKIRIKQFAQKPLPLFLEGFVHALKTEKSSSPAIAKNIYTAVRRSPLYDKTLKMYKVNASLKTAPIEIGRTKIFTPGWLENESIWLHMEYKYLLELLKAGLHQEFFSEIKNTLVPFMDPEKYKRSILENSSFLVSSAHPNQENHGRGFVARLSGAAAEFIEMWIIMTTGKNIFSLDRNGKLIFKLAPVLPAWLFKNKELRFKLLGKIEVVYINNKNRNTYDPGVGPLSYKLVFEDKELEIKGPVVEEPYSHLIRERKVNKIIVNLT